MALVGEFYLAYTAGIIDGEGCIGIYPNTSMKRGRKCRSYRLRVHLSHWLKSKFGGTIYLRDYAKSGQNWKPVWYWMVVSRQALSFLEQVYPYLQMKKPQAELAIEFQKERSAKRKGRAFTEEEMAVIEAAKITMNTLNKRGRF